MVQATAAAVAVPCGGRRALGEESQIHAANGEKHDDRHFILLGTGYAQTFFFKGSENASQSHFDLLSNGCFVLLPTAVILLILLSQITSHNLFALYVIQVSYCWILQNNIR